MENKSSKKKAKRKDIIFTNIKKCLPLKQLDVKQIIN